MSEVHGSPVVDTPPSTSDLVATPGGERQTEGGSADERRRHRALDRFFESYYRLRPVNATFIGVHDYDHQLPDWSPDGLATLRREMSDLRRELAAAGLGVLDDGAIKTRDWVAIDGALADAQLEIELLELDTLHFQRGNLSLALGEALFGVIALMTRSFASIDHRAAAVAARLRAFPLFLVGVRRTLEDVAITDGWRERVLRECHGGRILLEQVERWLEDQSAPDAARVDARLGLTVAREALAWFTSFIHSLRDAPSTRYASGRTVLELLLRRGHWIDDAMDSLRYEARETLEREMATLVEAVHGAGGRDWAEIRERLAIAHPAAYALTDALEETWEHARDTAREKDLLTWPEFPLRFVPLPPSMRDVAPYLYYLWYRSPAPFDPPHVTEYQIPHLASLPDEWARESTLRQWNSSAIALNHVVHHASIGHHVQNWHAQRAPSRIGRVAAVDCASRIAMFSGGTMAEGWACYATDLMEEADFFSPLERVAQQHTRVRLLARAVVDLELHSGRLTFEDAVALFRDMAGMLPPAARAEAVKCSMFPGTASMYWLGTRQLRELRHHREQALGSAFSLRRFHDELLSFGSIPVSITSRLIRAHAGVEYGRTGTDRR